MNVNLIKKKKEIIKEIKKKCVWGLIYAVRQKSNEKNQPVQLKSTGTVHLWSLKGQEIQISATQMFIFYIFHKLSSLSP